DLAHVVDPLQFGVLQDVVGCERAVDADVHVLSDRGRDDHRPEPVVVAGQVGAATTERYPERCAGNQHRCWAGIMGKPSGCGRCLSVPSPPTLGVQTRTTARLEVRLIQLGHSWNPAAWASRWNIRTVSSENSARSRPTAGSFLSRSWVTVITWQPISSACTTLSISRGLAQISSRLGCGAIISSARHISGTGSRPVSARRPAKTEMNLDEPAASHSAAQATWSSVSSAVTFRWMPSAARRRSRSRERSPRVFMIGILTYTESPHLA